MPAPAVTVTSGPRAAPCSWSWSWPVHMLPPPLLQMSAASIAWPPRLRVSVSPAASDGMGPAGSDGMGPAASDGMGPAASDGMGPAASDGMGPAACDGMGPAAFDGMGPAASDGMGPAASDGMGPAASDGMGPAACDGMGPAASDGMGPAALGSGSDSSSGHCSCCLHGCGGSVTTGSGWLRSWCPVAPCSRSSSMLTCWSSRIGLASTPASGSRRIVTGPRIDANTLTACTPAVSMPPPAETASAHGPLRLVSTSGANDVPSAVPPYRADTGMLCRWLHDTLPAPPSADACAPGADATSCTACSCACACCGHASCMGGP
eukprot:363869-Chlamydomonas_euryale.AAC.30